MSLNRWDKRTDANERDIIRAMERIGAKIYRIAKPLDLLVTFRQRTLLMECKTDKGVLTKAQEDFLASWPGEAHIVRSVDEAITALGSGPQKVRIGAHTAPFSQHYAFRRKA